MVSGLKPPVSAGIWGTAEGCTTRRTNAECYNPAPNGVHMSPRTIREFTSPDIWPIVEAWAEVDGHYLIESSDSWRLYQSDGGFFGRYIGRSGSWR